MTTDHKAAKEYAPSLVDFYNGVGLDANLAAAYLELREAAKAYIDDIEAGLSPTRTHPLNVLLEVE